MIEMKIEGMEQLQKKVNPDMLKKPVKDMLTQAANYAEAEVKRGTPVDTGNLRARIVHTIDASPMPLWAKVGTDIKYAPFVEQDTRPHFPPPSALEGWAHRHGIPVFVVCLAIARHGTKGKHMFKNALEKVKAKFSSLTADAADWIKGEWDK